MIRELVYVNPLGEELRFGGEVPNVLRYGETDLFDIDLSYSSIGGKITSFEPGIREYPLHVFMRGGTAADRNRLVDVLSYGSRVCSPGTLRAGESTLSCYLKRGSFKNWCYMDGYLTCDITLVSDESVWVRKVRQTLVASREAEIGGLDYPHDYPHDYLYSSGNSGTIANPFQLPAKCDIVFPGPCSDPYVIVAGNRYQVLTSADSGQLVIVRGFGRPPSIVVRGTTGAERSVFSRGVREEGARIFAEVPVGTHAASWAGAYNVEMTLYEERLSPWWT